MDATRKIKVLQCIRQGQVGGGESHLLSLVENLDKSKFEPVVLSFTAGPMIDRLNEMNIKTYVISTTIPFDLRVWKKVLELIKTEHIDLIHCHGTRAISNIFSAAKRLKVPLVYTIHGWSFHDDQHPVVKRIRIFSEKFLTRNSHKNIAVSASNMKTGEQVIPGFSAVVINNGINQEKFNATGSYPDIRKELQISPEAVLVIFIARFNKQKQPVALINAFKKAIAAQPNLKLLMVGDGEERELAFQAAGELLSKAIYFLHFRQDVPALLASADVFVLPSLWEGMPIGLLEAMSMGKAIIATNVDGTKEIITNNVNGILIEPLAIEEELPAALLRLANDKNLRKQFSANAIQTITRHFTAEVMTRKIENVYMSTVGMEKPVTQKFSHYGV